MGSDLAMESMEAERKHKSSVRWEKANGLTLTSLNRGLFSQSGTKPDHFGYGIEVRTYRRPNGQPLISRWELGISGISYTINDSWKDHLFNFIEDKDSGSYSISHLGYRNPMYIVWELNASHSV